MTDPVVLLALAVTALLAAWVVVRSHRTIGHRRRPRHGFPRLDPSWGTVYVLQDRDNPRIVKVGFTAQRTTDRRGQISRDVAEGGGLRVVYTADMHFARTVETLLHRRLPRLYYCHPRGKEWYVIEPRGIDRLVCRVERAIEDVLAEADKRGRRKPDHVLSRKRFPASEVRSCLQ